MKHHALPKLLALTGGLLVAGSIDTQAQTAGVGIGTAAPASSALLDLTSTEKGLLIPRMTLAQAAAIPNPADGLLVYRTDGLQPGLWVYRAVGGWVSMAAQGADNLGNHTATQDLNLNGNTINFGTSLKQQLNLWNTDYGIGIQPSTMAFRSGDNFVWYWRGSYTSSQNDAGPGGNLLMLLNSAGYLGLGMSTVQNRLDVQAEARSGTHATGRALYITGPFNEASNGVEFRHSNATQGIGFGFNSIYAAGTNATQHLNLIPSGAGGVGIGTTSPGQKLDVVGNIKISTSGNGLIFPDGTKQTTAAVGGTDNLGNHTATQNLNLASYQLVGNGGTSGLSISSAGNVGIGGTAAASALLDLTSTTKGLLPPRVTEAQRNAIGSPAPGLLVQNTNTNQLNQWTGTEWIAYLTASTTPPAPTTYSFSNGDFQTYTVPGGVTKLGIDMAGGAGGNSTAFLNVYGGRGGRVQAFLNVTPGQVLYILVGGSNNSGGYNGGGNGSASGGGASDIRIGGTALSNRVLVAGGGGGAGSFSGGGAGGGLTANAGGGSNPGGGGSQSAGGYGPFNNSGSLGQGGNGPADGATPPRRGGAGGGGYYGGGGSYGTNFPSSNDSGGGGGGSSYTDPTLATSVVHSVGYQAGHGYVSITAAPGLLAPAINGANIQNVGDNLGNHQATQPIQFNVATGPKVNLYNADYNIGVQGGTQYFRTGDAFAWFKGGVHNDGQFNAGSGGTTQMVLTGAGNLGIGITAPLVKLDVPDGCVRVPGAGGSHTWFNYFGDNRNYIRGTTIIADNGGHVGIGTSSPSYPLDVSGSVTPGNFSYGYLNGNGSVGPSTSTGPISIRASNRVLASEFNATSDRRIKNVIGLSDRTADLALLNQLRITNYTMKDRVSYGERKFKKVIAQEVEEVFPQAVNKHTGFLPDVYAVATEVRSEGDSLLLITLPKALATPAKVGQQVKLIGEKKELTATVARAASGTTLVVRGAKELKGQQVFVFGLEHHDVRTVDYEALAMLNVSATQELARQVAALQQQNAALQAGRVADQAAQQADHAALLTLQAQLARLLGETPTALDK